MSEGAANGQTGNIPSTATSLLGRALIEAGIRATHLGHFDRALADFDEALAWARRNDDTDLWDRAFCNRCAVEIELGNRGSWLGELRRIVLRSQDPENGFLAAYNVARAYELDKEVGRATFYARIAQDRCSRLERRDWLAWSKNQTANLLLADSRFEEACTEYGEALELMSPESSATRSLILDNLGYCEIVRGRYKQGFALLFAGLRTLVYRGAERYQARLRLSLCYAYLEIGRLRRALRHGLRALELATQHNDTDSMKYAHFLLGETYNQLGCDEAAREYFTRLQQRFYPGASGVPDLLMAIDVRQIINLKA
jgi:tetratricopeptide (TPR) repeat protein